MKQVLGFVAACVLLAVVAAALVPIAVVWCAVLLVAGLFVGSPRPPRGEPAPRRTDGASIMILNWNGMGFLAELLPSLRRAVERHGGDHEIILVDNGSTDDSVPFATREYPEVRIVQHPQNLKFVRGYNDAFAAATRDIVVLLNNDMVVDEGFLGPLLAGFADPDTFAVSSQIFMADPDARRVETGLTGGAVVAGVFKPRHDELPPHVTGLVPVLWAGGGSAAFDRRRLLELGGFDRIYDPFYFEDTGLSYEAWKRGWTVLLAPESKVVHAHQGTSGTLPRLALAAVRRRNQHLFAWRHLTDPGHTLRSSLLLPLNVPRLAFGNHGAPMWTRAVLETRAILLTIPRLLPVLGARIRNARHAVRSDRQVFDLAHSRHRIELRQGPRAGDGPLDVLMISARVPKRGVDGSWGLFELIKRLGQRHRVTLFSLMDTVDDDEHVAALRPLVHRMEAWPIEREPGVADLHHRLPKHLRNYYTSPGLRRKLAVLLRTERFDVVQVDYIEAAAMLDDLVRGTRSVHVVHEPWFRAEELRQVGGLFPRILRRLRYMQTVNFEARLYAKFAVLSCFSAEDAAALRRWCETARIEVNPMGANIENIAPCAPSRGHTILSVGGFAHLPNVDAAIWFVTRILPLVQREVPDATVRFAGGSATDAIVALKEQPGVELLGRVPDLTPEMEGAALTIAPVREGGGLRTKVLESFAYGRTMVMTPLGAVGVRATDGVECRIAADEEAFAAAIVELLRDDEKRHRMELAARELVREHFTADIMTGRTERLYRELAADRRGGPR